MQALLDVLGRDSTGGTLEIHAAGHRFWSLGHGEPRAAIRLRRADVLPRILARPGIAFGETYMDGDWEPESDLLDVLCVAIRIARAWKGRPTLRLLGMARSLMAELNTPMRSLANASRHYDLEPDLYARFLDADLHYSCAYFSDPGMTLEQAQQAKCAQLALKLRLRPGARVLDIGCGWGSLALYLAEQCGVRVVGVTASAQQLQIARERARQRGLAGRVAFEHADYRTLEGRFDAIVSVGMFEHVGRPQYRCFFRCLRDRLESGGVAVLHSIARTGPPDSSNLWIRKHVFPGSYIPAASEVLAYLERAQLRLGDLEVLQGLHYARTLAVWHQRFVAARPEFRDRLGERFCRMWEFYLLSSLASFRLGDLVVLQVQMAHDATPFPLTRDYLYRPPGIARPREPASVSTGTSGRRA